MMRKSIPRALILTTALFLTTGLATLPAPANAAESRSDDPTTRVDAFHRALAEGDRDGALALLADDAVIFESGGAEMSPAEYASHHLAADMEFSGKTERTVVDRRVRESGRIAWVLTRFESRGTFRDREIDSRGTETMVLVRDEGGWKIAHIHWSSRNAPDD